MGADSAGPTPPSGGQAPAGSPATGSEAAAALDHELEGALREFDQRMREEMERLAEETTDAERSGSRSSGGQAGYEGGAGGGSPGGSPRQGEGEARGDAGGETRDGSDSGGEVGGSGPGGAGSSRVPADVGDGSDDDIVARQLREAAIAEDDPELREKLWDEYRRYKASLDGSDEGNK
jgi:hypothetical protein